MKLRYFIYVIIVAIIGVFVYAFIGKRNVNNYEQKIEDQRLAKDEVFRTDDQSPLSDDEKLTFEGLQYYPVEPKYRVKAKVELLPEFEKVNLQMSDSTSETFRKYGYANFQIDDKPCRLLVLKPDSGVDENYLFIPFYDATSADETYGAGRYVEPTVINDEYIEIDFNKAYNPYCAYNHHYYCPIPPKENKLPVRIKAGEKKFENHP